CYVPLVRRRPAGFVCRRDASPAFRTIGRMADEATTRRLTREELTAWRSFLRAHARLSRVLEAELVNRHPLSLGGYDVLVQLAEAPEHRLRMAELADAVLLS